MTTPTPGRTQVASQRFGNALEAVVSILVLPWALAVHRRIFKQMDQDWKSGHRP